VADLSLLLALTATSGIGSWTHDQT